MEKSMKLTNTAIATTVISLLKANKADRDTILIALDDATLKQWVTAMLDILEVDHKNFKFIRKSKEWSNDEKVAR